MEKTKIVALFAILILFNSVASVFAVSRDEFPRLDELIGVVAYPEAAAMAKARAGEIDNVMGMINPDNVEELMGLGWSISANPGFHMCYLGINCRPYTLETSGQPSSGGVDPPYGLRPPGTPLYPLNITEFRYALHLLIGCRKTDWIAELYRFINVRLDTTIPPASVFWFNPEIPPVPYDPVQAYQLLLSAGFSNSTGIWLMPNGQELRKIWVMSPSEAPPSVTLTEKCVDSWNAFFGKGSDGEYYFIHSPQSFYDIIDWAFVNRDHDIYFLCWGLGRNPDYLYDFFHPDVDIPEGNNSPGLNYPPLNDLLYAIKYWRWPDGTPITTTEEMREIVWEAQEYLYVLTPYIPLYSRKYHNAYAPGLQCWVESLGYGSNNWFTYNWINWKLDAKPGIPDPDKPSWRFHIGGPLARLNPITSTSAYDWQVLNLVLDGLLGVNPYTHEDILWAAKAWIPKGSYEPWSDPEQGVEYGMKVTFKLRPGINWQDGVAVDANTVKWNYDFLTQIQAPRYYDIWANYVTAEVPSSDTITIYINNTGLWLLYSFAGSALLVPPHIYGPYGPVDADQDGTVTYSEVLAFKPYNTPHPTVPGLTCLIGTGTWIFKEWNTLTQTVRLVENTDYFAYHFLREDINFDFKLDLIDLVMVYRAFGCSPWRPEWQYGRYDINCDNVVNELDLNLIFRKIFPGIYDVAVTNLKVSRPRVYQECGVYVEVAVQNKGTSPENFTVSIKFETGEVETSQIYLNSGSSKTILLAVVPRAFLFEEISREPYGVPYGNIGNLILIGSSTFLQASTGAVKYGDIQLPGGLIELYSGSGTLIRRVELLIPPNKDNTVFTAGNYGNGLYVLGATNGELFFLDENGEFGRVRAGDAPINQIMIEGLFVKVSTPYETISLKRCSMNFQLLPGYYHISAVASIVPGEINIEDNTFIDGVIKVVLAGDVNDDNIVDMTDIGIILRAYGTTTDSPNWNPNCDINNDNIVDMSDVGIALRNYAKKHP